MDLVATIKTLTAAVELTQEIAAKGSSLQKDELNLKVAEVNAAIADAKAALANARIEAQNGNEKI